MQNAKKAAFVNYNIQKEVDDDLLMAEFGITPEKKEVLHDFSLMKTKSINWDLETSKNSSAQSGNQTDKLEETSKAKTMFKELPTIKTASQSEEISVIEDQENGCTESKPEEDEDFVPDDEDNQPYKSDDENDEKDG